MRQLYISSVFILLALLSQTGVAQQRFFIEKGNVAFFSDGVIEDIAADNNKVTSIFDASKGDVAYLLNIKDFTFEKRLMQVHFNEKYMETEKFPKSSFQGKILGFDPAQQGVQQVKAIGKLTIHGVTRDVTFPGTAELKDNILALKSKFTVKLLDYNIKVPQIVWQNIAQQVEVTVDFYYRPL
ncbi:MAG TPA: YceI family protein [Ohtaekwangia sp.]|uniref:YceI family protein n=1 Tax=Ohtaekwangia sp. TaxID=2066019 RepID=UPI002F94030F